jgi:hypothetical protein
MPSLNLIKRIRQLNLRLNNPNYFTPAQRDLLEKRWERIIQRYDRFGKENLIRAVTLEMLEAVVTLPKQKP